MFNNNAVPFSMNVVPENSGNGYGGWGEGSWFIWIILILAIFGGWGNGYGYGYGGGGSVQENYVLTSDFATIERKLDSVNNGLCDGFYAQNSTMLNGFNGVTQAIADSNYAIQNGMTQNRIAAMQDNNAITAQITGIGTQLASCCCDLRYETASKFADLNYNIATQDCATRQTVNDVGRNLADTQNANTRAILDKLGQMEANAKDDKIAELTAQVNALQLAASQQAQNAYLVDQLGYKAPVAAFQVPAPWQYGNCGCNTGCGC